tara:strand:+ start:144 stop:440 length:297 start_codon:yes stop_codon:yes gene_type:complete
MDWITILDWYCSGNKLTKEDIQQLDSDFKNNIETITRKTRLEVAPPHICNTSCVERDSYWLHCLAVVLDKLDPLNNFETRRGRLIKVLHENDISKVKR